MIELTTTSVDQTREVGAAIARFVQAGDVVLLAGDLGAGKTAFAQGFGRGLGVTDRITSPTFTLARHYRGRLDLNHLDVYRLEHLAELFDVGLPELLDEGGVTIVEWGDAILPAVPADFLEVRLTFGPAASDGVAAEDHRTITLRPVGVRWHARQRVLSEALAPWSSPC